MGVVGRRADGFIVSANSTHSRHERTSSPVAHRAAGRVPEPLVGLGERPGRPHGDQRSRAGQRARFAGQDLQVVVQDQGLGALVQAAHMGGHGLAVARAQRPCRRPAPP